MNRRILPLLAAAVSSACGPSNTHDVRVQVPPAMDISQGVQFVMPQQTIPAASEKMFCWVPSWKPGQDYLTQKFVGMQGKYGHHVAIFSSLVQRDPGSVYDCTDSAQMAQLRPLLLPDPAGQKLMPDTFAVRMAAGTQLVVQSHYVNAGTQDLLVADVAQVFFSPAGSKPTEASYLIMNTDSFELPAHQPSTVKIDCSLQPSLTLLALLGHMHEHGKAIGVTRTASSGGATESLYSVAQWNIDYRDKPPVNSYPTSTPLRLNTGDHLQVTCQFDNQTDASLRFPQEMCDAIAVYYPAQAGGPILCP